MNYPKRGCMSDDGKYYTHTDGTVWLYLGQPTPNRGKCAVCKWLARGTKCGAVRPSGCNYRQVAGAYVPSDEEREACESMILGIEECGHRNRLFRLEIEPEFRGKGCSVCPMLPSKTCPLRVYLDSKKRPAAWEVKP